MNENWDFLNGPAQDVAPRLLGCEIERVINNETLRGRIVETEAYDQADPASHSFRGPTLRTQAMFGPAGYAYVYFTYGMHYCMNIVCGLSGHGAAVLIRAIEPIEGIKTMQVNRHTTLENNLTNGPAKLCYALAIDKAFNGHNLRDQPLRLVVRPKIAEQNIVQTTRIGIRQAATVPWRFYIKDNPYISASVSANVSAR